MISVTGAISPSMRIPRILLPVAPKPPRGRKAAANPFRLYASHRAPPAPRLPSAPDAATVPGSHSSRDSCHEFPQANAAAPALQAHAAPLAIPLEIFLENYRVSPNAAHLPTVTPTLRLRSSAA